MPRLTPTTLVTVTVTVTVTGIMPRSSGDCSG